MPQELSFRFAIIDIETTGLKVTRDKITEIAVTIFTENGIENRGNLCLIPIPKFPQKLVL